MTNVKKNLGDEESASALRTLFFTIFVTLPNLISNGLYKTNFEIPNIGGENIFLNTMKESSI